MQHQPEFLTVDDVVQGARAVQDVLSLPRWKNRFENVLDALYDEGMGIQRDAEGAPVGTGERNIKALDLLLQYRFGKPVAVNENINREVGAEEIAQMASQVYGKLHAVPRDESA